MVLLVPPDAPATRRQAGRLCAAIALLLGLLTFTQHLTGWDFGIDQLLAVEPPGAAATASPNRMGPPASLSFTLIGLALLAMTSRRPFLQAAFSVPAVLVILIGLLSTVGYLYDARELYGLARFTGIAWPTALSLLALGIGVLCARPDRGFVRLLTADNPGGALARRLILPAIVLPMTLGWLRLAGERVGHYDAAMGTALVMLTLLVTFSFLIYLGGQHINRTTSAIEQQRQLLAVTLASIGDAVLVTDTAGRVTFLNGEAERLTGWASADAVGQPLASVFRIINEKTRQTVESPVDKVLRLGNVVGLANHTILIARDGRETPIDDSGAPVRFADGTVHGVILVFRDIAERYAAEAERNRLSEQRQVALDAARLGWWHFDPGNQIATYDKRYTEIFGVDGSQRPNDEILKRIHPDDLPGVWARVEAALNPADPQPYFAEYRVNRPDGSVVWVEAHGVATFDGDGAARRATSLVGTVQDITERKRADAALRAAIVSAEQAKSIAEQANKAKDHFIAVLSHELRTPLTPVLATVSMLQQDDKLDPETRENLEMVRRNVELEARLIDDLLDVTRIERGKVNLDRQTVELTAILRRAAEVCRPDIRARRLEFTFDAPDDSYPVQADPARLQQVFWNLLKNAIKFTPEGGRIGVRCRRDAGHVVAEVHDSGDGIDPSLLPRLFTAFQQGDRRAGRQFGGLGLGLAISKAIIDLHDGTLTATSDGPGQGATFTVTLPLTSDEATKARSDEGKGTLGSSPSSLRCSVASSLPLRILLVEDHADTARIIQRLLAADGHDVHIAGDVATALRLARGSDGNHSFDLLLSDLGLPDGSGIELMHSLRAAGLILPAIALSGYGQEQDIRQSRQAGFTAHLTKPVSLPQLHATIATVMGVMKHE